MRRRDFLKNTASGIVLPSIAGGVGFKSLEMTNLTHALSLATETDKTVVMIYLAGGNDGLNTLIPLDQMSNLSNARSSVILPENQLLNIEGTESAFHPAFVEMKQLYDEGRLSVIQNVGYPVPDYSHFRSTDIWMSASDSDVVESSGWTGRYLDYQYPGYPVDFPNAEHPHPLAIEIGWNSSMLFQGAANNMGMVINDPNYFYELIDEQLPDAPNTRAGERLEYVRLIAKQSQTYGAVVKEAADKVTSQGDYPEDNWLAEQLKVVARCVAGGLKTKLYLVEYGGFDTHDSQVDPSDHTQGNHAYLLGQVSQAIKAFVDDCDGLGVSDRVLGMTFSEFGRRVLSNASGGTDHGTTAPMFLFGNNVNGGIIGENPIIPANIDYWYNMDMAYDFRQVYSTIFEQWLCVPTADVQNLLFKDFEQLPFIKNSPCAVVNNKEHVYHQSNLIKVFPNPVLDYAQIEFEGTGAMVRIDLYDLSGKKIASPIRANFGLGSHIQGFSVKGLTAGTYYVKYSSGTATQSAKLIKMQ